MRLTNDWPEPPWGPGVTPTFLKTIPLFRDPLVIPDSVLDALLHGRRQVTCTPLRIPRDLSQRDFIRLETESKRWLSYKGAKLWVCARVLYRKLGQRGAPKVTLSGLVLFPVGRLRQERVMG